MSDIYTETTGTTAYVNGERGTVTGIIRTGSRITAAFVNLDERPAMLHVTLGAPTGDRGSHNPVLTSREVDRDEFDRLMGIPQIRHELGWRDPRPALPIVDEQLDTPLFDLEGIPS